MARGNRHRRPVATKSSARSWETRILPLETGRWLEPLLFLRDRHQLLVDRGVLGGRSACTEDSHDECIRHAPIITGEARLLVDGVLRHTATEEMSRMILPQNIVLTIWASDTAEWAGAVDATSAPTTAEYDWIRVYDYVAQ